MERDPECTTELRWHRRCGSPPCETPSWSRSMLHSSFKGIATGVEKGAREAAVSLSLRESDKECGASPWRGRWGAKR